MSKDMDKENNAGMEAVKAPKYRERLRARYADVEPKDDAEWDDLIERGFTEDEEKIKLFEENYKVIDEILDSDKDAMAVISEMIVNGTPFRAAVAKFFDADSLTPKEGDEDYEFYQKNASERKAIMKASKERFASKAANEKEAYDNLDKYAEKKGLSEDEKKSFVDFINNFYEDLSMLRLSEETIDKLYKAMNYDKDVEEAAAEATADAKNQAIEAARIKRAKETAGDGVPGLAGGSSPMKEKPRKKPTIFDTIPERNF